MTGISRVVPAILTDDPKMLTTMVHQAETFTDYVQFDIMDGKFVPSRSITWEHLRQLPMKLSWEAHLMVQHPEDYFEGFSQAGAKKLVFHFEASNSPRHTISLARSFGIKVGIAVNPETPASAVLPFITELDGILLLSVHPGFYGAKFLPEVLGKVAELRRSCPDLEIGIDGGIKESNIIQVAQVGLDVIYVGSAIFLQPNPAECFQRLQKLARECSSQPI